MNKEVKITALSLGMTYAGCFFGAGYVSGKELYEFFGSFGVSGYWGILLSISLFFVFGILLIRNVLLSKKSSFDNVIIINEWRLPKILLGIMTVFMMFGIFVVMTAGAGALLFKVFGIPHYIGCLIFVILVSVTSLFGINGAVKVFSAVVPVLVITTLIICITSLCRYGYDIDIPVTNQNKLLGNWFFSALTYVSYNMVTLIGTMIPVASHIKKKITVITGIGIGCIAALSIALGILMSVTSVYGAADAELPMLEIAYRIGDLCGIIYAILLLIAMFGTSLSGIVAINEYLKSKTHNSKNISYISTIIIAILAFICSLRGFGNLVNTVYPIFGYIGFVILLIIILNNLILKQNK